MNWLSLASLLASILALAAALLAWQRLAALERKARPDEAPPSGPLSHHVPFDSASFQSMLEALERKGQEAIEKIARREQAFFDALAQAGKVSAKAADAARGDKQERGQDKVGSEASWAEKAEAVVRLAEEGHDALAIARLLGLGQGEVQLVLDMRKAAK